LTEGIRESVRVVDRRHFAADGSRRTDAPPEEAFPAPPPPPAAAPPAPEPSPEPAPEPEGTPAGLFEGLVGFLVENAMVALRSGAGPAVVGQFIDLLEMLQRKTKGNLTPQESRVLGDTLGELKLLFLKVQQERGGGGPA